MRIVEFELLLKSHTFVKDWFEPGNLYVDYEGVAQHYGLNTEVLDFTSDIDIALFFAICPYDRATDSYRLPDKDASHTGIIYVINPMFYNPRNFGSNEVCIFEDDLKPIGLQPFERPAVQRGYGVRLPDGKALDRVRKYEFEYTPQEALDLYERFCKLSQLWVKDELIEPTKRISSKNIFAFKEFSLAWQRYPIEGLTRNRCAKLLRKKGIRLHSDAPIERFTDKDIRRLYPQLKERYEEYSSRMGSRKIISLTDDPEDPTNPSLRKIKDESPYMDTKLIAESLLLRIIQTGRTASSLTKPCQMSEGIDISTLPLA